jgi:hypothetical protein
MNIEALWTKSSIKAMRMQMSTIEFKDRIISIFDLATVSSTVIVVSFIGSRSKEWAEIGQRLAILSQLKTLFADHCDSGDSFCIGVCSS